MGDLPLCPLTLILTAIPRGHQGLSSNLILFKFKSLVLLFIRCTRREETESPSPERVYPEFKKGVWNSKTPNSSLDLVPWAPEQIPALEVGGRQRWKTDKQLTHSLLGVDSPHPHRKLLLTSPLQHLACQASLVLQSSGYSSNRPPGKEPAGGGRKNRGTQMQPGEVSCSDLNLPFPPVTHGPSFWTR